MKVGDRYVAHAPGEMFGLDGRAVRVWAIEPDGEGCPVGTSWYVYADRVAAVLGEDLNPGSG